MKCPACNGEVFDPFYNDPADACSYCFEKGEVSFILWWRYVWAEFYWTKIKRKKW